MNVIDARWQGLSPPQLALVQALDKPRKITWSRCSTYIYRGTIWCTWSVHISVERRGLIQRCSNGKWERT